MYETGLAGLDPMGFFKKTHLKKPTILPIFGFFQFSKIFVHKTDKKKINSYAV